MELRKIAATAGITALALGAALPAAALTVGGVSVGNTTNGSADINVGVNADGSLDAANNAGSSTSGVSATTGASTSIDTQSSADSGSISAMIVTRADVDADAVGGSRWDSSRTYSDVKSNDDLKAYVASQMRSDTNLSAVETTSSDVAVTYKQHGRFLGFIPVTLDATATVDQNGQVTMHYPWYSFLTTTDRADVQAKLQAQVDAMTGQTSGTASTTAAIQLTAEEQARLIEGMRSTLNNEFNASVDANADASASGSTQ